MSRRLRYLAARLAALNPWHTPYRAVGRVPAPLGCLGDPRADQLAELESWYALPDYHRPPSATADSYLDPEDLQ